MAGRRDATTLPKTDFSMAAWPSGFAYDLNVVLPQPVLPPIGTAPTRTAPSYADIAANRGEAQRRTASGAGGSSSIGGGLSPALSRYRGPIGGPALPGRERRPPWP